MDGLPLTRDLVLIGGGHAHALVLRMWGMNPLPGARLTVINPHPVAPYSGMLPGHVAGHYRRDEMMIDLVRLARHAGARLIQSRATGIDRANRLVLVEGRDPLRYDIASIDIGITTDLPALPGFLDHAIPAKPFDIYSERWQRFVSADLPRPRMVIIGAGVAGVELALASAHRLQSEGRSPDITLVDRDPQPLRMVGSGARRALLRHVAEAGIALLAGVEPVGITASSVILSDGRVLPSDFTLGVAGARPQKWLEDTGLDLHRGFVRIDPTLRTSDASVFAAGDCAEMVWAPRPKAGVYAVRQAPILLHNLRAALSGGGMRRYRPQSDYLKLISAGGKTAVADKWGLPLDGAWLWRWKDGIDRRFIAMLADLPKMALPPLPHPRAEGVEEALGKKPLCGGCGAKVGASDLSAALAGLPAPRRPDVLSGPGDDAAILRYENGVQVMTTDHLRSLCDDPALMARLAAVHALGDIWAMGAQPQVALAQIILPRMSARIQADTLREIMAAAADVFRAAGADVVGGHTTIGAELTIGFTVTGLAARAITKRGVQPGDALILTKPIGSGTVMAALMAQAPLTNPLLGEAAESASRSMARALSDDATILAPEAHAMTDVTGFGLAGHLLEMLEASNCAAELDLAAVPLLPGAEALAATGQESTIAPANRAAAMGQMLFTESPKAALLFDPQTCGGLLAAVNKDKATRLVAALREKGSPAAIIGKAVEGAPFLTVT
ncbi:selenide, water dikinase SelD [Alitabrizicola rongguiensis]|uniref:selenide, water dikinase SelD n=1 Tax=Alitabrizicola rongguiensis TaxID=2909234 RepID=UPI0029E7FD53|nr:selenide, water dikinase SelD [Tabrizicola rongguiensis]